MTHNACECGCGELSDECSGNSPRPLGSIRTGTHNARVVTPPRTTAVWQAVCSCGWQFRWQWTEAAALKSVAEHLAENEPIPF